MPRPRCVLWAARKGSSLSRKGRCHMSEQTPESAPGPLPLPDAPSIEWLRKQAKRRLAELRQTDRNAKLAAAQIYVAAQYGFATWRARKAHAESLAIAASLFN